MGYTERDWPERQPMTHGPAAGSPPWRPAVCGLLLLACLIPRVWAAWNWKILWGDALLYLHASEALNQGDLHGAFSEFGLNLYTVILAGLLRLGDDWQTIARCWSVAMATLAVLPLWGWIRRMFDDRTALIACLAYAFHGKLVSIAPLIIRDSTFWFLFASALYCLWRAIVELRLRWFLAAGAAITLALHTRTEGWLLLVVLLGWSAGRFVSTKGDRLRLVAGTVLCLVLIPLSLEAVNAMWLRGDPQWDWMRPQHVRILKDWWQSWDAKPAEPAAPPPQKPFQDPVLAGENERLGPGAETASRIARPPHESAAPAPPAASPPMPTPAGPVEELSYGSEVWSRHWSTATFNRKLLIRLVRGYTYVGGLLTLLGMFVGWRVVLRREHLVLLLMGLILLAMIRVRYVLAGIDIRYFMPIVLLSLPWMARGVIEIAAWFARLGRPRAICCGLAVLTIWGSLADAGLPGARLMEGQAAIGQWIHERLGPDRRIGGYFLGLDMVAYYAKGKNDGYIDPHLYDRQDAIDRFGRLDADVLLVSLECPDAEVCAALASRIEEKYSYVRVRAEQLPKNCNEVIVLIRTQHAPP
jgi:4-amino-4-deoxy-L-arabinose transferase-like glycosyltransferase